MFALLVFLLAGSTSAGMEVAELDGRWAKLTKLESLTDLPVLGDVSQKTEVLSLVDIKTEPNGETLYRERTCRLTTKTMGGVVRTSYPVPFLKMLIRDWSPLGVDARGGTIELVQKKAPRWYGEGGADQDQDGNPGVTIKVSGIIDGEVYASIREFSTSYGRVESPNEITGRVEWEAGLKVLGASSSFLDDQPKTRKKEDPDAHTFVMKRVKQAANCRLLVEQYDDVF
jgi:hypothetical protein